MRVRFKMRGFNNNNKSIQTNNCELSAFPSLFSTSDS